MSLQVLGLTRLPSISAPFGRSATASATGHATNPRKGLYLSHRRPESPSRPSWACRDHQKFADNGRSRSCPSSVVVGIARGCPFGPCAQAWCRDEARRTRKTHQGVDATAPWRVAGDRETFDRGQSPGVIKSLAGLPKIIGDLNKNVQEVLAETKILCLSTVVEGRKPLSVHRHERFPP
jgi:hypothetical protein